MIDPLTDAEIQEIGVLEKRLIAAKLSVADADAIAQQALNNLIAQRGVLLRANESLSAALTSIASVHGIDIRTHVFDLDRREWRHNVARALA